MTGPISHLESKTHCHTGSKLYSVQSGWVGRNRVATGKQEEMCGDEESVNCEVKEKLHVSLLHIFFLTAAAR